MLVNISSATFLALFLSSAISEAFGSAPNNIEQRLKILEQEFSKKSAQKDAEIHSLKIEINSLKLEVQTLSIENKELKSARSTLEGRVDYLETITRNNVPRTCQDLMNLGLSESGTYLIDPDGPGVGDAPISVFCDMTSAAGTTVVTHDMVDRTVEVEHCEGPGCHSTVVSYNATARQLKSLVDLSEECSQVFEYNCFTATLIESGDVSMAWWIGADGQPNPYWVGGQHELTAYSCACGQHASCIDDNYPCNCESGLARWMTGAGMSQKMASLPVTELRFGGSRLDGQQKATFGLMPLMCSGRKAFIATESCETLRLAGHSASGYYQVDGGDGLGYNLVFCDMEKEPEDPGLETPTAVKLPEYQLSFDASYPRELSGDDRVLTFYGILTNEGNAFNGETGTFTAPFDGIYTFTISNLLHGDDLVSRLYLRVNGRNQAAIYDHNTSLGDHSTTAVTVVLSLSVNDTVDIYLVEGDLVGGFLTHFTGILLHPL